MTKSQYSEYLASTEWLEKRRKVLLKCRGYCEGCGAAPATEVHHLTYAHIGHELLWELVAVCDDCHDRCHGETR